MSWDLSDRLDNPVWRNRAGEIACPGDACPKNCDLSCPIWCNTEGLKSIRENNLPFAQRCFKEAIDLAPDFADAHNNLGTVYGMQGEDQLAYEEFKQALALKPNYAQALRDLIIAEKNTGRLDDALKHCDQLDSILNGSAAELRNQISQLKNSKPNGDWTSIMLKLLNKGRSEGYIVSDEIPYIPELMMMSDDTCGRIINGMIEYRETHPRTRVVEMSLIWAAYAGIGAVYHWNINWSELQATGLFEILTRERGIQEMDEYVLDCIGIPFGSEEQKAFNAFLYQLALISMAENLLDMDNGVKMLTQGTKAMFAFGMVFEMDRLGMTAHQDAPVQEDETDDGAEETQNTTAEDDKPEVAPEATPEPEAEVNPEAEPVLYPEPQIADETYEPIDYHNVEKIEAKPVVLFCRKCGGRLPADSEFCQFCGTKIIIVK